jgi:predicted regulator of Ras-like GTPase activity (Roadblock/LC7/MglB family)
MTVEILLNELKEKGIGSALMQVDGTPVASTIALKDSDAALLASVANVADAIMKREGDKPAELELSFGGLILVIVPVNSHLFCGMIKDRSDKKTVLEYAQKAKEFL